MLSQLQKAEIARELKKIIPQIKQVNDPSRGGSVLEISCRGQKEYLPKRSHSITSTSSIR